MVGDPDRPAVLLYSPTIFPSGAKMKESHNGERAPGRLPSSIAPMTRIFVLSRSESHISSISIWYSAGFALHSCWFNRLLTDSGPTTMNGAVSWVRVKDFNLADDLKSVLHCTKTDVVIPRDVYRVVGTMSIKNKPLALGRRKSRRYDACHE
jgi:hypothetical protein